LLLAGLVSAGLNYIIMHPILKALTKTVGGMNEGANQRFQKRKRCVDVQHARLTSRPFDQNNYEMKNSWTVWLIVILVALLSTSETEAQTFKTLYSFSNVGDGRDPISILTLFGSTLYGTTVFGGTFGSGTVFRINVDGSGFTNIHSFTKLTSNGLPLEETNGDGGTIAANVIASKGIVYGTATYGGIFSFGTVFRVNIDGTGFKNLHNFDGSNDGSLPHAGLILSGSTLYGTAGSGGSSGWGTVFAVNTNGAHFTNLHNFTLGNGVHPESGLILCGNLLFGTTAANGNILTNNLNSGGTVFSICTNGTDFTNLYSFTGGNDGNNPWGGLVLLGNRLYGTTISGGAFVNGDIFSICTNGSGFTNLFSFPGDVVGYRPSGLLAVGNALYGTSTQGGCATNGSLFAINIDGSGFTNLYSFSLGAGSQSLITNSDGALPIAGLILSGNTLYGTAHTGGSAGNGTVFSLSFPSPHLSINQTPFVTNAVLTWASGMGGYSYSGYTLQSTTNLASSRTWKSVSGTPAVFGEQYIATNPVSSGQMFFRLSQ
jgi:uncharacterized repeat protein (TIGR03803 family)